MLNGIGVTQGIAIGKAYLIQHNEIEVHEFRIPRPLLDEEVGRYIQALKKTRQQLRRVRKKVAEYASTDIASFVDAHLLMLRDSQFVNEPIRIIREHQCNAEWSLKLQRDTLILAFEEIDDPYLSARKDDVRYVVERILRNLLDHPDMTDDAQSRWLTGGVVVADEITPDEVITLYHQGIAALVTELGGPNSHTAILSRSLGITTVVGVHNARLYINQSELTIIDGANGLVYIAPGKLELDYYRRRQEDEIRFREELDGLRDLPTVSQDGHAIILQCNMELEVDLKACLNVNCAGIGLFRTEMLFMNRHDLPDENEQYQFYVMAVNAMNGHPVTIRTLDVGADKNPVALGYSDTSNVNPALGLRAIRLCLQEPELLLPQLRAILRASAHGPIRIMIPLLTTLKEIEQVKRLIEVQRRVLVKRGFAVAAEIPIGGMVEVPAAAIMADLFASQLDFLSIGTNDLIQYTLAADRMNDEVNYLFDPLHPAVIRLIKMTIEAGKVTGIPVSMCGEMAGDPRYTRLLLGLGLREFSMQPTGLLAVKRIISLSNLSDLTRDCVDIKQLQSADDIGRLVDRLNRPVAMARL